MPIKTCRNPLYLPLAIVAILGLWTGPGAAIHATLAPQLTLNDLAGAADAIVIATAAHTESVWIDRSLVTRVTLDVEKTLVGDTANPIHVFLPGGVDASRRIPVALVIPGQPRMRRGDRMLLFLHALHSSSSDYGLVGDAQGRFVLFPQGAQGLVAARDLTEVRLVGEDGVTRGGATRVPLELLVERIRTLLALQGR